MSRRIVPLVILVCLALGALRPPVELPRVALQAISRPRMDDDYIPYGHRRKRQMARYSRRHYGRARWRLRNPKGIVLHFTGGASDQPPLERVAAHPSGPRAATPR